MTAHQYRQHLARLGLDHPRAATLLGVDVKTSRRWAAGDRRVPGPTMRFLEYLVATGVSGEHALAVLRYPQPEGGP